jgi:hypothetical protein
MTGRRAAIAESYPASDACAAVFALDPTVGHESAVIMVAPG